MEIKFPCAKCGQPIAAPLELCGMTAQCPSCEESFVVPHPVSTTTRMYRRWIVPLSIGTGLLLLAVIIFAETRLGNHSADLKYWQSLQPIWQETRTRPRPDPSLQQSRHFEEYAAQWSKFAISDQEIARKLRALPEKGVNSELIDNILRTAEFYDEASQLGMDAANMAMEMKGYGDRNESAGAFVESLLRGLAGDSPMNKFYESQADAQRIKAMQAQWLERGRALDQLQRSLAAELAQIRIKLATRDGADF